MSPRLHRVVVEPHDDWLWRWTARVESRTTGGPGEPAGWVRLQGTTKHWTKTGALLRGRARARRLSGPETKEVWSR